ncbi:hypothetical protein Tco_0327617 [Tanacetum coccineum]
MFHKKNVDFAELIWEDFLYQIDNRQLKKGKHEIMPYPRFTKIIINHFLSIYKSIPKGPSSGLNIIKDDGVLSQMKFVRIREDVQEYRKAIPNTMLTDAIKTKHKGLPSGLNTVKDDGVLSRMNFVRIGEDFKKYGHTIPETMLTERIKQTKAYQTFIKYSTSLIPPKKSRGKGSQGKKSAVTPKPTSVEVFDESDPKPARRQTGSRRKSKKKVSIAADDNIIPEPDVALELEKSMSLTKAAKEEATRQVYATYE